jgi:cysteine sulfinate desulfinase/cysteine desulfurase-like protein
MGLPAHRTQNSIRLSLGAGNTVEEVDFFLSKPPPVVRSPKPDRVPAGLTPTGFGARRSFR